MDETQGNEVQETGETTETPETQEDAPTEASPEAETPVEASEDPVSQPLPEGVVASPYKDADGRVIKDTYVMQ